MAFINLATFQQSLFLGQPKEIIQTFTEAIQTIDIPKSVGKMCKLWIEFAKFYHTNKQTKDVSTVVIVDEIFSNFFLFRLELFSAKPL